MRVLSTVTGEILTEEQIPERRLAAILAGDIAGYSRMMHEDEERTLAALTVHRKIVEDLITSANGQIFNTAGDGVLAEFPSVVEAYHCAVAIQRALARENEDKPDSERLELRIGINVGDVMVKDGDVFGDGVNIASRIEALAEAGGICISRAVRDQLRDRQDMNFADLGEHQLKNIPRPVRAFRAVFDRDADPTLSEVVRQTGSEAPQPASEAEPESDPAEIAFWQTVQESDHDAEYRLYLERYPNGAFAELAQARLRGESSAEDTSVELMFWDSVRESSNAAMIRAYLDKYPEGQFRTLAEIILGTLSRRT
jgi:class 3 adenylate cyclase